LISAIGGVVFLATSVSGNNNWFTDRISSPTVYPGLLPIANAIGKDLMLDVSPQLHPSVVAGERTNEIQFEHWIDPEVHCEDCLRLEIPNNGKIGVAFSNEAEAGYNFEEARKVSFYIMGEEEGAKVNFKALGNDRAQNQGNTPPDNPPGRPDNPPGNNNGNAGLLRNQEFALTTQNVTLNNTWNYHEISLEGVQNRLTNVKYPFAFEVDQGVGRMTILYLKGIMYSNEPIQEQYLLEPSSSNITATTLAMNNVTTTALNVTLSDNATETVNTSATVEFNASVANGEEPYLFDWNFGDGTRDTQDTDGIALHTFATPGSYNVTLDVVDSLNNTGSASTTVNVADEIGNEEEPSLASSEENMTQDSQTADSSNTTNTTAGASTIAADENENLTDEEEEEANEDDGGNTTDNLTETDGEASDPAVNNGVENSTSPSGINGESTSSVTDTTNSPPIANAGNDLVGVPEGQVILDASRSSDPDAGDTTILSYQWEQESGPTAEINDQASPTPIVTLPDVEEDSTIVFSLTVNDGSVDSEEEGTVSIFVDYSEQLASNAQQRILKPSDTVASQWTPSGGCEGDIECISDGSHATFVAAGTENTNSVNLYSFDEFSGEGTVIDPSSLVIERVVAEMYAKKLGNTGYLSFAADDSTEGEPYFTPSISIGSNSFQKYYQVWDTNPVTGEEWTYDSLNSLVAGFRYDGKINNIKKERKEKKERK
jgi:hypothetical protein